VLSSISFELPECSPLPLRPRRGDRSSLSSSLLSLPFWPSRFICRLLIIYCSVSTRSCYIPGVQLTHDRTPPINPKLYPVAKSLPGPPGPSPLGISKRRLKCDRAEGLVRGPPRDSSKLAARAGLPGLLACQNCLSSLPSSWPVVDQLVRIASLISVT
jgi:hypothetical protein